MFLSIAVVTTDAPARYAKQLIAHLGRKVHTEPLDGEQEPAGRLLFAYGIGTVLPQRSTLVLRASAPDLESLSRVQDVLQRHLEKFGARKELLVQWGPPAGEPETVADGAGSP